MSTGSDNALALSFKAAMACLASTPTIITAVANGQTYGMTATAVTSLSVDPPSLLICINRSASIYEMMQPAALFCINILQSHHSSLCIAFGGKSALADRFNDGEWQTSDNAVPYLCDASANVFCEVDRMIEYGTHSIVIGKVQTVTVLEPREPLLYGDGRFLSLSQNVQGY